MPTTVTLHEIIYPPEALRRTGLREVTPAQLTNTAADYLRRRNRWLDGDTLVPIVDELGDEQGYTGGPQLRLFTYIKADKDAHQRIIEIADDISQFLKDMLGITPSFHRRIETL